ncbi:MAG: hypothetical protein AAF823_03690 [Planctomycetota bacterium]
MEQWLLNPATWVAGIPVVLLLGVITFEVGMAWTIGSLPRNKALDLKPEHWRKMRKIWLVLGLFWPIAIGSALLLVLGPLKVQVLTLLTLGGGVAVGVIALRRRGRWRRHLEEGRCVACGYDLRGLVSHRDECPECGTRQPVMAVITRKPSVERSPSRPSVPASS